ncbi:MAG TPA: metalloregulator ArsR/SmtB family transcription factor [Thermoanaerobaculia bacterium]|nr:metalloregulator ArsR/SmtB family transcription factor [Thermoanaerobaculia bacterium]
MNGLIIGTRRVLDHLNVLADATRGRLLLVLEGQELTVSELCSVLQMPQSTVSRHLKVLVDDGWLEVRPEGTSRFYLLEGDRLDKSRRKLWRAVRGELADLPAATQDAQRLASVLAARASGSREFFRASAGEWDRLRRELFGRQAGPAALLGLLDPELVVGDLGCGTGAVSAALAPFVAKVVAVDGSPAMLAAARERLAGSATVELRAGELEELPVADGELDAAVLHLVLHHLAEPGRALAEVGRALRPGGRLLVVDMSPHERQEYRQELGHVWLGIDRRQLGRWCEAAGLERLRVTPLPPDPEARGPNLFAATARRLDT